MIGRDYGMLESLRLKQDLIQAEADLAKADKDSAEYRAIEAEIGKVKRWITMAEAEEGGTRLSIVDDAEGREFRQLVDKTPLTDFFSQRRDGSAHELRQAALGDHADYNQMPAVALLDFDDRRQEQRAVSTFATPNMGMNGGIIERLFGDGDISYLGGRMPSVPAGQANYAALTGGAAAVAAVESAEVAAATATLVVEELLPKRLQAAYQYPIESAYRVAGSQDALKRDLRATLKDGLEQQAIVQILTDLDDPTVPGAEATWVDYYQLFGNAVDGKAAKSKEDVRILTNSKVYKHASGLQIGTAGDPLIDRLPGTRFRVSTHIAEDANDDENCIAFRSLAPGRLVVPVWLNMEIIDDRFTRASHGERIVTVVSLFNAKLIHDDTHVQYQVQTA